MEPDPPKPTIEYGKADFPIKFDKDSGRDHLMIKLSGHKLGMCDLNKEGFIDGLNIGDKVYLDHNDWGTVQKVTDDLIYVLADKAVAKRGMLTINNNLKIGNVFENTTVYQWLTKVYKEELPQPIQKRLVQITIPSYGQIFGHDCNYRYFEEDDDEQFPLMKEVERTFLDKPDIKKADLWWWIRNRSVIDNTYGFVDEGNYPEFDCDVAIGVRPLIILRKEKQNGSNGEEVN